MVLLPLPWAPDNNPSENANYFVTMGTVKIDRNMFYGTLRPYIIIIILLYIMLCIFFFYQKSENAIVNYTIRHDPRPVRGVVGTGVPMAIVQRQRTCRWRRDASRVASCCRWHTLHMQFFYFAWKRVEIKIKTNLYYRRLTYVMTSYGL